jgi:hypothetical protein
MELLCRPGCCGTVVKAGVGYLGRAGICVCVGVSRHREQRDISREMAGYDGSGGADGHGGKRSGYLGSQRGSENAASGEPHDFGDEVAQWPGSCAASGLSSIGVDLPRPLAISTLQRGELEALYHEATCKGP